MPICCLINLPPPSPPKLNSHSFSPTKTTQLSTWNNRNEGWLKRQCFLGVTGMIMALEMGNWVAGESTAIEMNELRMIKWSEERMCPQWRLNSLETIMPENLPRPSARRRLEAVRRHTTAPPLKATLQSSTPTRCFSL